MADKYLDKLGIGGTPNDGNSGAIGSPWLTLNGSIPQLTAGDRLYVRGDTTYPMGHTSNGVGTFSNLPSGPSASVYTTIQNYPGDSPQFTGIDTTSSYFGLYLGPGKKNIKFDGVDFNGLGNTRFMMRVGTRQDPRPENIVFQNMEIYDTSGQMNYLSGTKDVLFYNCHIHGHVSTNKLDHLFYAEYCEGLWIDNCIMHDTPGRGIQIYSGSAVFYTGDNFKLTNNIWYDWGQDPASAGTAGDAITVSHGNNGTIYNNIIYAGDSSHSNFGIAFRSGGPAQHPQNCTIYHNTFHQIRDNPIYLVLGSGTQVKNNLMLDYGTATLYGGTAIYDTTSATKTSNYTSGSTAANMWVDPSNATLASRDYHLKAGSAAIDPIGVVAVGVTFDKYGTVRSVPVDYGAVEYGTNPPESPLIAHNSPYIVEAGVEFDPEVSALDEDADIEEITIISTHTSLKVTPSGSVVIAEGA